MEFDRSLLNALHFVGKCRNDVPHARIPNEFIRSIGDVDYLVVYTVLQSMPPTHRWKTELLKFAIREAGHLLGEGRIDKAMSHLNQSGWISYVVLKDAAGRNAGSIVQVHTRQLPEHLRGEERRILQTGDGSFQIYDFDGKTQLSIDAFNAGWSEEKEDRTDKLVTPREIDGGPLPRNPGDRSPGDQYKEKKEKEEPHTPSGEGAKIFAPLGEELDPGPIGPGSVAETVDGASCPVSVEGGELDGAAQSAVASSFPVIDWKMVRKMALESRRSEQVLADYHRYLAEVVFPALEDPPTRKGHWRAEDNLAWCRTSPKGQFLLSIAIDEDWTPDHARYFRRNSSACSLPEIRLLLRTGEFAMKGRVDLSSLIPNSRMKERGTAWRSMLETARKREEKAVTELKRQVHDFPGSERLTETLREKGRKAMKWAADDDHLYPSADQDDMDLFCSLYGVYSRASGVAIRPDVSEWMRENWSEISSRMARFVASDKLGAVVALEMEGEARQIWGIDWNSVRREHTSIAEGLNRAAMLYELHARVSADPNLFPMERELDPATRSGLLQFVEERRERSCLVAAAEAHCVEPRFNTSGPLPFSPAIVPTAQFSLVPRSGFPTVAAPAFPP